VVAVSLQKTLPKRRRLLGKQTSELDMNPVVGDQSIQSTFFQMFTRSNENTRHAVKDTVQGDGTIIEDIQYCLDSINVRYNDWPEYVKRLAVAILMTFQYRFVDITEIELVTLMYCAEGDIGICAHKGTAWLYYNGGFRAFDGLCSKTVLKRMRTFMKHCEGLYKCFKDEKEPPTESELIDQIHQHYSGAGNLYGFKKLLIKKANIGFGRKGGGKGKSKDKGGPPGANQDDLADVHIDDASETNNSWQDSMKQYWHRISKKIFDGMLSKSLLPYFNEWCETEKVAV